MMTRFEPQISGIRSDHNHCPHDTLYYCSTLFKLDAKTQWPLGWEKLDFFLLFAHTLAYCKTQNCLNGPLIGKNKISKQFSFAREHLVKKHSSVACTIKILQKIIYNLRYIVHIGKYRFKCTHHATKQTRPKMLRPQPVRPDLAKFRHLCKVLTVYFLFDKVLSLL